MLLSDHYAPLVVDRNQRTDYLDALDAANGGDLRPLVRLFAGLELVALKSELSAPVSQASRATGVVPVAHELVGRLRDRKRIENEQRATAAAGLAAAVQALVVKELGRLAGDLEAEFRAIDPDARVVVNSAAPGTSVPTTGAARSFMRPNVSTSSSICMMEAGGPACG